MAAFIIIVKINVHGKMNIRVIMTKQYSKKRVFVVGYCRARLPHKIKKRTLENITAFLKVGFSKLPVSSLLQSDKPKPKTSLLFPQVNSTTLRIGVPFYIWLH